MNECVHANGIVGGRLGWGCLHVWCCCTVLTKARANKTLTSDALGTHNASILAGTPKPCPPNTVHTVPVAQQRGAVQSRAVFAEMRRTRGVTEGRKVICGLW